MDHNPYEAPTSSPNYKNNSSRIGYRHTPTLIKGICLSWTLSFVSWFGVVVAVLTIDGNDNRGMVASLIGFLIFLAMGIGGSIGTYVLIKKRIKDRKASVALPSE